jgi:lipopolysaccharide transport system ATP-binding protein
MSRPIIEIKNVSKSYKVGVRQQYYSLRDVLSGYFSYHISKLARSLSGKKDKSSASSGMFWALKNISFNVGEGEMIGIIGRNGAGKSTLLKVLSRITPPTTGEIKLRGSVASFLEVGTGFHQELTGRENIFLNGAILGMKRREVLKQFDDIIEFSELGKFIDTPLKHYSSGMYARLAFAVAAHLESEILIVDEVLAVGDASFQKKCLGKMGNIVKKGRTVLFVSHNMGMIQGLCKRCVLLDEGKLIKIGPTKDVVEFYLGNSSGRTSAAKFWKDVKKAPGDNILRLHSVRILNDKGNVAESIDIRSSVRIEIKYWNLIQGHRRMAGIILRNKEGQVLFQSLDLHNEKRRKTSLPVGIVKSTCFIPGNLLTNGRVYVDVLVGTQLSVSLMHINEANVVSFVVEDNFKKGGVRNDWSGSWPGALRPMLEWEGEMIR